MLYKNRAEGAKKNCPLGGGSPPPLDSVILELAPPPSSPPPLLRTQLQTLPLTTSFWNEGSQGSIVILALQTQTNLWCFFQEIPVVVQVFAYFLDDR